MDLNGDVDGDNDSYGVYIDTAGVSTDTGVNYGLFTKGGDYDKHQMFFGHLLMYLVNFLLLEMIHTI